MSTRAAGAARAAAAASAVVVVVVVVVAIGAALAAPACGAGTAPTAAAAPLANVPAPRAEALPACARAWLAGLRLPHQHAPVGITPVPRTGAPAFVVIWVEYGEDHDCEAGCFHSSGTALALRCDRIGWIALSDYEHLPAAATPHLELRADDTALFDGARWNLLDSLLRRRLLEWMLASPALPADVRARATAAHAAIEDDDGFELAP